MISNNYQNQFSYGAVKDVVPQSINDKLPQNVQNFDVMETVSDNTAIKAAQNADTDPFTIGLTGVLWIAIAQFCQFFAAEQQLRCFEPVVCHRLKIAS